MSKSVLETGAVVESQPKGASGSIGTVVLGALGFALTYLVVFAVTYMVCFPVIARIASLDIFNPSSDLPKNLSQFVRDAGSRATANLGAFCIAALAAGAIGSGIARLISEFGTASARPALRV